MEINVIIEPQFRGKVRPAWLKEVTRKVLAEEHVSPNAEVGLVVTGQAWIRRLNKKYLDEDRPTDVLSFPMLEPAGAAFVNPPDGAVRLGEIIISYPQALKQAQEHGHPVEGEITLLIVHGALHLLGYDHDVPERTDKMRAREAAILAAIEERL